MRWGVLLVTSRLYFIHIYFPILIGAIIYTFFRADKLFIFLLYEKLFFSEYLAVIRQYTMNWYMPDYIVYTLPDALWVYAFTIFLYTIWLFEKPSKWRAFFLSIPLMLGVGSEIGQYFFPVLGTFDWVDFGSMLFSYLLAYNMTKYLMKRE